MLESTVEEVLTLHLLFAGGKRDYTCMVRRFRTRKYEKRQWLSKGTKDIYPFFVCFGLDPKVNIAQTTNPRALTNPVAHKTFYLF